MFIDTIHNYLPKIEYVISGIVDEKERELTQLLDQIGDCEDGKANRIIIKLISEYARRYSGIIKGNNIQGATEELKGGSKIYALIRASFKQKIDGICLAD